MSARKFMFATVALAMILGLALAGCGPAAQPTQPPAPTQAAAATAEPATAASEPAKLPLEGVTLTLSRWAGDPWEAGYKAAAAEFEKMTGAKVIIDAIPYEGLREKQVLEGSSHTGTYDVLYVHPGWLGEYVDNGYVLPLDDYINNPALNPPGFSEDSFVPSILNEGKRDGKIYSFQDFVSAIVVAYRKDLFEQAGLSEPKSWDDVLADAKALNKPGEMAGIVMPGKRTGATMDVFTSLLLGCGGWYFDDAGNPSIDTPCALDAMNFYAEAAKYAPEGILNFHWDETVTTAAQGKAAMAICMTNNASWFDDPSRSSTVGEWGFVPLAYQGKPASVFEFWHLCVSADSKNPEAAYQLAQFLADGPQQAAMAPSTATGGCTKDFYSDTALAEKLPILPVMQSALSNSKAPPSITQWPELQDRIELAVQNVISGKETSEEALKNLQTDMVKIMNQ